MTCLPILWREMRVRSRSRGTYWTRLAVALVGALLCVQQLIISGSLSTPAAVGRLVFDEMVGCAFVLCCAASLLAAEAIASERREGTLGLLFLTRVRGLDVVAGKLASVGTASLGALTGLLPALMIPLLAGGVTAGEAVRKSLGLAATLALALAAGLCAAAAQSRRLKAAGTAVLLVAMIALGPFLCMTFLPGVLGRCAGLTSPLVLVTTAGETGYQSNPGYYWTAFAGVMLVAELLLLVAGFQLRRSIGRDGGAELTKPPPPAAQLEREVGLGRWRPDKEASGPMEWLAYRQQGVSAVGWVAAVVALAFSRWVSLATKPLGGVAAPPFRLLVWPLGLAAAAGGGIVVAWVAGRFFAGARRTRELELLLPTPLGAETVVADQWRVLRRMFVWPVLWLQVATLVPVVAMTGPRSTGISSAWPLESALTALLSFGNTFFGTGALCRLGLWFGLTARRQIVAVLYAVGLAQGLPWLASLASLLLGTMVMGPLGRPQMPFFPHVAYLSEAAVLVLNLVLAWLAVRGLAGALESAEPLRLRLRRAASSAMQRALVGLRGLRHWTPSSP